MALDNGRNPCFTWVMSKSTLIEKPNQGEGMKKIASLIVATLAMALPGTALAHTGNVSANCTTVTYSYNANFAHATIVTETFTVDGKTTTKTFAVPASHTATDVITFTSPNKASFTITAGASWKDGNVSGSIPATTFTPSGCAVVCVPTEKTVYVDRIVYVDREVPGPTVEVAVPGPTVTKYVKVPGKTKTKTRIVYRDRWHIRWVPWHPLPPKKTPGVTG